MTKEWLLLLIIPIAFVLVLSNNKQNTKKLRNLRSRRFKDGFDDKKSEAKKEKERNS